MSADNQRATYKRPALEFKSNSFSVPVLVLASNDISVIAEQLKVKTQQAPEFFKNSPLILDVQEITQQKLELSLTELLATVKQLALVPIGLRGGSAGMNEIALKQGIAVFSIHHNSNTGTPKPKKIPAEKLDDTETPSATKIVTHPVRSGQQVYAKGDLIILSSVSAGAEVMADGNIHIYGTLRGKVLAGIHGDTNSRIFCSNLQAELVAIAGNYQTSEELSPSVCNKPVQVYLKDKAIIIEKI